MGHELLRDSCFIRCTRCQVKRKRKNILWFTEQPCAATVTQRPTTHVEDTAPAAEVQSASAPTAARTVM
eukprot:4703693-Karenia_brevis.AAC.1